MKNDLLTRAVARVIPGDLAQKKIASGKQLRVYWGIDPTGGRIHIGHSVPMRKLRAFADAGHHTILVIGSFTAMIGDPSDRTAERQRLSREEVEENFKTYKRQAEKILDFSKIEVVYTQEWLDKLGFREIADLASHFTVQQMSERAMFAERISKNKPVYQHEFLYPLMVGYDSVVLDVDCEIGGTDQEFNMLAGRTLQEAYGKREKFVLTTPLIEGTDGRKMSKTYGNCMYLDDEPSDMFGKVMAMRDELMGRYFECCTDVPMTEIAKILKQPPRDAKERLAREIVTLYHGIEAAGGAEEEFNRVFRGGGVPDDIPEVTVKAGTILIDLLMEQGLVSSKSEARRLVKQKGITINEKTVPSVDTKVESSIVKVGKRKFLKISIS